MTGVNQPAYGSFHKKQLVLPALPCLWRLQSSNVSGACSVSSDAKGHSVEMNQLIHAPGLGHPAMDRVAAFGAAVWLAMQAPRIGELQLALLDQLILQPQQAQRDVLICRQDGHGWPPQLWAAYAQFDASAERAYVRDPSRCPAPGAWASGDRLWMLHLIAPQNYSPDLHRRQQALFASRFGSLRPIQA